VRAVEEKGVKTRLDKVDEAVRGGVVRCHVFVSCQLRLDGFRQLLSKFHTAARGNRAKHTAKG